MHVSAICARGEGIFDSAECVARGVISLQLLYVLVCCFCGAAPCARRRSLSLHAGIVYLFLITFSRLSAALYSLVAAGCCEILNSTHKHGVGTLEPATATPAENEFRAPRTSQSLCCRKCRKIFIISKKK